MNRVIGKVVVFAFYGLLATVFMFTASLTYDLLSQIMPNDNITPIFGLALFDIGALIWILTFLKKARGLGQRAICLIGFAFDFIFTIIMVLGDLFLGGQKLAVMPEFLQGGATLVWIVGAAAAINLALGYLFHILDPEESKEIEIQTEVDTLADEGLKEAKKMLRDQKPELAKLIAGELFNQALDQLRMYQTGQGIVLDSKARELGQVPHVSTTRVYQSASKNEPLVTPPPASPPTPPPEPSASRYVPTEDNKIVCYMCRKPAVTFKVMDGHLICPICETTHNASKSPNA